MVISDELFDYRFELMATRRAQARLAAHWLRKEDEYFRSDIVKTTPFAKVKGDVDLPIEGFDEITIDVGTLCDACGRVVAVGESVIHHVRIGKIYCSDCSTALNPD